MGVKVLAIVAGDLAPEAVELGDFPTEAAGLAAVREAQAQGVVLREGEGVTVIPAARITRYVLAMDGHEAPPWIGRGGGRRRAEVQPAAEEAVPKPRGIMARLFGG